MADITLTDSSSASINATVFDDSLIGKTPASVIHFLRSDVLDVMNKQLDQVQINSVSLGFDYEPQFSVAGGTATFKAGGGPSGEIDLYKPAAGGKPSPLFPKDQFGTDIEMGACYYLALAFQLTLSVGANASPGAFTLTFTSSASANGKMYLPFAPSDGAYPTLKSALEILCGAFLLPSSVTEVIKLKTGAVFTFDSQGTVGFQGEFDVLAAVNPTATPGISTSYGPIAITAGPAVTIGGKFSIAGEFQVRVWKRSDTVFQLGFYKKRDASLNVSIDASLGADVAVGGYDLISKLYGLLGDSGKLDSTWLKAHVPDSVANDVQSAYQTAVQTKLSIAIDEECDTSITDQAAFSWNFDTAAAGSAARDVYADAIRGDLSKLMNSTNLPVGITKAGNIFDRLKDKKHVFTFNFLGLFDHASVQESILEMATKVSEDGQLVMTDTAHLTRLSADATPLIKSDLLRKVFAEDCVATVGYASSFGSFAPQLNVNYSYYSFRSHARPSDLQLFVETSGVLSEVNANGDWSSILQSGIVSQGASFYVSLGYDGPTGSQLFLDRQSNARTIEDLEKVGRVATLSTPGLGLNQVYTALLADDLKWQQIRGSGSATNFYASLGVDQITPPQWAIISYAWTLHILFWASAMHSAAQALQAVVQYLNQNPGIYPLHDQAFLKRRQTFASQLKNAIQKTPLFNDALGLVTMYLAATPKSKNVVITYAGIVRTYD